MEYLFTVRTMKNTFKTVVHIWDTMLHFWLFGVPGSHLMIRLGPYYFPAILSPISKPPCQIRKQSDKKSPSLSSLSHSCGGSNYSSYSYDTLVDGFLSAYIYSTFCLLFVMNHQSRDAPSRMIWLHTESDHIYKMKLINKAWNLESIISNRINHTLNITPSQNVNLRQQQPEQPGTYWCMDMLLINEVYLNVFKHAQQNPWTQLNKHVAN